MKNKIFFGLVLIVLIVMFSFFFFSDKTNDAKVVILDKDNIILKIDNSSPLSDELGVNKTKGDIGYVDFSIKALNMSRNSSKYEIYVKQINSSTSINGNYNKNCKDNIMNKIKTNFFNYYIRDIIKKNSLKKEILKYFWV